MGQIILNIQIKSKFPMKMLITFRILLFMFINAQIHFVKFVNSIRLYFQAQTVQLVKKNMNLIPLLYVQHKFMIFKTT